MRDQIDGFAVFLHENPQNIPRAINFFYAPIDSLELSFRRPHSTIKLNFNRQPFLAEMHEDKNFLNFKNNFLLKNKKNIGIYIVKLTIAAGCWQWAYNNLTNGGNNLGVVFLSTGTFASLSLNIINAIGEKILHKKPLRAASGTLLSLFPTTILYDGMWEIILELGNVSNHKSINFPLHTLLYFLLSVSFVPLQTKFSNRIDAAYPEFKAHTYKPPLAVILLLTLCYMTFGYLPPLLNSSEGDIITTASGVFFGAAFWGFIEYLSLKTALMTLENEYKLFETSSEQSECAFNQSIVDASNYEELIHPASASTDEITTCDLITDCIIGVITLPFRCVSKLCCTLFGNSTRQEAHELAAPLSDPQLSVNSNYLN